MILLHCGKILYRNASLFLRTVGRVLRCSSGRQTSESTSEHDLTEDEYSQLSRKQKKIPADIAELERS